MNPEYKCEIYAAVYFPGEDNQRILFKLESVLPFAPHASMVLTIGGLSLHVLVVDWDIEEQFFRISTGRPGPGMKIEQLRSARKIAKRYLDHGFTLHYAGNENLLKLAGFDTGRVLASSLQD